MKSCSLAVTALVATILSVGYLFPPSLWAQESQGSLKPEASSSTITMRQFPVSVNPSRTKLTREENGNRVLEKTSVETMGSSGHYQAYLDIEKETVKADSSTVRTVERSYGRDPDGRKQLFQVTEEESRTLAGGEVKTVRTTSDPDLNGGLGTVQKEIEDRRLAGPDVWETKTSVLTTDLNGGLAESVRVERRETQNADHTVQFQQSTLVQDGSGQWQAREVRHGVVKRNGADRTSAERVWWRPGSDGNMVVVQRTVRKESAGPNGDSHESTETESVNLPWVPYDGSLHLVQQATSTHHVGRDGSKSTETQVEQPNAGSFASEMRVTSRALDVLRPGPAGTSQETTSIQWLDGGGSLSVVWVYVGNSTKSSDDQANLSLPAQAGAVPAEATTPAEELSHPE
jgi:hypothetical protein